MKVYLVMENIPYEADNVIEVYDSIELANKKVGEMEKENPYKSDSVAYYVHEWEVRDEL